MSKPKILLADDDKNILLLIPLILTDFTILPATGLRIAQRLFLENTDLVGIISDYRMNDGDGLNLFNWVRRKSPIPFLLISGYPIKDIPVTKGFKFLAKPFTLQELIGSVQCMGTRGQKELKSVSK